MFSRDKKSSTSSKTDSTSSSFGGLSSRTASHASVASQRTGSGVSASTSEQTSYRSFMVNNVMYPGSVMNPTYNLKDFRNQAILIPRVCIYLNL